MQTRWSVTPLATAAGTACLLGLLVTSCGGGNSGPPTAPTPPNPPPTNPPPSGPMPFTLSGRIVSAANGQAIPGARIAPADGGSVAAVTSAADGAFQLSSTTNPASAAYQVTVSADGYVERTAYAGWTGTRAGVDIDLLPASPPFSIDFYRQLVRNGHEAPGTLEPLRRWTTSPRIYIRTVDQDGRAIDPVTLDVVQNTIRRAVPAYSGGTLTVLGVETGTETRGPTPGWINVELVDNPDSNFCGQSFVGANPGLITLSYNLCGCGAIRVRPSTVAHEVGHAMGFWHVSEARHIMAPGRQKPCPEDTPTDDEQFHARMAYRRAQGNRDPDQDVSSAAFALAPAPLPPQTIACFGPGS